MQNVQRGSLERIWRNPEFICRYGRIDLHRAKNIKRNLALLREAPTYYHHSTKIYNWSNQLRIVTGWHRLERAVNGSFE